MSDSDKMRAEFEAWATPCELNLRRLNEGYLCNASNNCWIVWQAAYAAGQEAERAAIQKEALQQLTDEAQELDMGY
tara:strand:- start:133 stop:360 length:228 start_codon:yes stop_codon:yes gene_type:complete